MRLSRFARLVRSATFLALRCPPSRWRRAVHAPEQADEVRRIGVADAFGDDVDAFVRMKQAPPRFGHAARDDPGDLSLIHI